MKKNTKIWLGLLLVFLILGIFGYYKFNINSNSLSIKELDINSQKYNRQDVSIKGTLSQSQYFSSILGENLYSISDGVGYYVLLDPSSCAPTSKAQDNYIQRDYIIDGTRTYTAKGTLLLDNSYIDGSYYIKCSTPLQ